ncbi:MAG TPA: response regulator transcription factor [Acidimicrobiales bacterium]|nr:response regulator transcription factor [Acidimicrobiales bacterium]
MAILDDHQLISASVAAALRADGYQVVVPKLEDADQVKAALRAAQPVVALLDLDLGSFGSGESLLPELTELGTRTLVVSGNDDDAVAGRCLLGGAWGWVPKSTPLEGLLEAVRRAGEGVPVNGEADRDRLLRAWRARRTSDAREAEVFERLTRREAAVLGQLQEGMSVEQIAAASFVSQATVRTQVRAILTKLEVRSQMAAVVKAMRAGWTPPSREEPS